MATSDLQVFEGSLHSLFLLSSKVYKITFGLFIITYTTSAGEIL